VLSFFAVGWRRDFILSANFVIHRAIGEVGVFGRADELFKFFRLPIALLLAFPVKFRGGSLECIFYRWRGRVHMAVHLRIRCTGRIADLAFEGLKRVAMYPRAGSVRKCQARDRRRLRGFIARYTDCPHPGP